MNDPDSFLGDQYWDSYEDRLLKGDPQGLHLSHSVSRYVTGSSEPTPVIPQAMLTGGPTTRKTRSRRAREDEDSDMDVPDDAMDLVSEHSNTILEQQRKPRSYFDPFSYIRGVSKELTEDVEDAVDLARQTEARVVASLFHRDPGVGDSIILDTPFFDTMVDRPLEDPIPILSHNHSHHHHHHHLDPHQHMLMPMQEEEEEEKQQMVDEPYIPPLPVDPQRVFDAIDNARRIAQGMEDAVRFCTQNIIRNPILPTVSPAEEEEEFHTGHLRSSAQDWLDEAPEAQYVGSAVSVQLEDQGAPGTHDESGMLEAVQVGEYWEEQTIEKPPAPPSPPSGSVFFNSG